MASVQSTPVPLSAAIAAGAPIKVSMYDRKAVYFGGAFVATHQVQISPDSDPATTAWFNEGAAVTTTGSVVEITKPCRQVRINTTAFTSQTLQRCVLSGTPCAAP
jgi:hypothetical protein